jgi:hypothetical protein
MRIARATVLIWMALAIFFPMTASANPFSDAWKCAKATGKASVAVGTDVYKKGEILAKKAGPLSLCLVENGPEEQALVVTSSALTALRLAKPSLLGNECESRIKGLATKPFANALATLIPSSSLKDKLVAAATSDVANDEVWSLIEQFPPPVSSVPNQIHCGCLISDSGLSLTDMSEVTDAVAETSQKCGSMLDSAGLGFINKLGGYASKLAEDFASDVSGTYDEYVKGQDNPDPSAAVYQERYGDRLDETAHNIANHPNSWQSDTYWICNSSLSCEVTLADITAGCIDYYDNHKMSAKTATKVCTDYQNAMVSAASIKAKHIVPKATFAALPKLIDAQMMGWLKNDWAWRMPKIYEPPPFGSPQSEGVVTDFRLKYNGSVTAQYLAAGWRDVLGDADQLATEFNNYNSKPATGIYANAKILILAMVNEPDKAVNLAYAGAMDPLRDKLRAIWQGNRKRYGFYQLHEWYPTPTWSYRYDCPRDLEKTCATLLEEKFDKTCYKPMSEFSITGPKPNLKIGGYYSTQYIKKSSACKAGLAPIIARAKKLSAAGPATIAGLCSERLDRDAKSECNQQLIDNYESCANDALKAGLDDASDCFDINYELVAHPGISEKSPTNPADIPEKKKKGSTGKRLPSAPIIDSTQLAAPEAEQTEPQILEPIKPIQRVPALAAAKSTLCQFTSGPRAGEIQDYAPMAPIPVGSNCQDARGSFGTVIAQ